jgi:hypothetical protein
MKPIALLIALISAGCGSTTSEVSEGKLTERKQPVTEKSGKDFLAYFPAYQSDSFTVEVEPYIHERAFDDAECIPLVCLARFNGLIQQTKSASTGAKPIGKVRLQAGTYFLTLVQQDDYGPVYYGLVYDPAKGKSISCEKIAEHWGDAGDSQVTYSKIRIDSKAVTITKLIETCHADLEEQDNELAATDQACNDSTIVVQLGNK